VFFFCCSLSFAQTSVHKPVLVVHACACTYLATMATKKPELYGIVVKSHTNLIVADYLKWLSTIVNPKSVKSFGKVAGE